MVQLVVALVATHAAEGRGLVPSGSLRVPTDDAWTQACRAVSAQFPRESLFAVLAHPLFQGESLGKRARSALIEGVFSGEPPEPEAIGESYEALVEIAWAPAGKGLLDVQAGGRRKQGSHFTPRPLAARVVDLTLAPLLAHVSDKRALTELRIGDPTSGGGAFLMAAARHLAGVFRGSGVSDREARSLAVAALCGVDRDPLAVLAARAALWVYGEGEADIRVGDAVLAPSRAYLARQGHLVDDAPSLQRAVRAHVKKSAGEVDAAALCWEAEFAAVDARGGFDALVGNPPWIAYAGRAAEPLSGALRKHFAAINPAFHGYRTLQGLVIRRAAELLRPGGRMGFIMPTSLSDLDGYEPTRRAHDALCQVDAALPDLGHVFEGVFLPCMVLLSTRRETSQEEAVAGAWSLHQEGADPRVLALVERLKQRATLPPSLFGERGYQTQGPDVARLGKARELPVPLRIGADVRPFEAKAPSQSCEPARLTGRFRSAQEWGAVRVLIRQTARYPLAALSDGLPFRNSILAGFDVPPWTAEALLAYLNATPVRFYHYHVHRDARQGMPQLKIGHLRRLPTVSEGTLEALHRLGISLGRRNAGISVDEQATLDELVADDWHLTVEERALVAAFGGSVKG